MAYNEFAYFYDELNSEADYDALYRYVTDELAAHGIHDGILADVAPTVLKLMGLEQPAEMTGKALVEMK